MNNFQRGGYSSRRSGSGGAGCGCTGITSGPVPFQANYQPVNQPFYQPIHQPNYQPNYQPTHQSVYPTQMGYQPSVITKQMENPAPSNEVIGLLEEAVAGESGDQDFYQQLITLAPTVTEKEIITEIRDDEMSHFTQFRLLFRELTGNEIDSLSEHTPDEQPLSYMANLRKALFGEMAAVEKYRRIRAELSSKRHRDIFFNIITDELIHMGKYNYLITLNRRS